MTTKRHEMISDLQRAIWKLEEAKELISLSFSTKSEEEIDAMFCGSIDRIIAIAEISINAVYETEPK